MTLKVYDVLGNEIATLVNEAKPAGKYEVEFQSTVGSGSVSYILKMNTLRIKNITIFLQLFSCK